MFSSSFSEYILSTQTEVVTHRQAIPLDENEDIYVGDIKTCCLRAVIAETYMLTENEEFLE